MASVEASSAQGDALCYASVAGVRDEAFVRPGEPNPLWQHLLEGLRELGPLELAERERRAQALLREDGDTSDELPVTFAEGIPCRYARPGTEPGRLPRRRRQRGRRA